MRANSGESCIFAARSVHPRLESTSCGVKVSSHHTTNSYAGLSFKHIEPITVKSHLVQIPIFSWTKIQTRNNFRKIFQCKVPMCTTSCDLSQAGKDRSRLICGSWPVCSLARLMPRECLIETERYDNREWYGLCHLAKGWNLSYSLDR